MLHHRLSALDIDVDALPAPFSETSVWFQTRRNHLNMIDVQLPSRLCLMDVKSIQGRDTIAGHYNIRNTTIIHITAKCTPLLQNFLRLILQSYSYVRLRRVLGRMNDGQ